MVFVIKKAPAGAFYAGINLVDDIQRHVDVAARRV